MFIYGIDIILIVSCICIFITMLLIMQHRFSMGITLLICVMAVFLVSVCSLAREGFFEKNDNRGVLFYVISTILIVQVFVQILAKNRGLPVLFGGLAVGNLIGVGDIIGRFIYARTDNLIAAILGLLLVDYLLTSVMIRYTNEIWKTGLGLKKRTWGMFCMVPFAFYCLSFVFHMSPDALLSDERYIPVSVGIILLMPLVYLLMFSYVKDIREQESVKRKEAILKNFEANLVRRSREIATTQEHIHKLRHNARHMKLMLRECFERGDYEELRKLLYRDDPPDLYYSVNYCENVMVSNAIDVIVKQYPEVTCDIRAQLPREISVGNIELAMVVSNLLENACMAVTSPEVTEKKVSLMIICDKGKLIGEVKNPYAGVIVYDKNTGLPASAQGEGHGMGLLSVRDYMDKYHGEMDISDDDGIFTVRFLVSLA